MPRQAFERGARMTGARAHHVMADLEEGPIIAQGAELIGHAATLGNLVPKGRQMERRILTGAIGLHIADRVPVSGEREIVFRS